MGYQAKVRVSQITTAANSPSQTTGLCTRVSMCSSQQVETFLWKAFLWKAFFHLEVTVVWMFPRNVAVLTTPPPPQRCERHPWARAGFAGGEGRGCPHNGRRHREKKGFPVSLANVPTTEPSSVLLASLLGILYFREIIRSCQGCAAGKRLQPPTVALQAGAGAEAPKGNWRYQCLCRTGPCTIVSPLFFLLLLESAVSHFLFKMWKELFHANIEIKDILNFIMDKVVVFQPDSTGKKNLITCDLQGWGLSGILQGKTSSLSHF